MSMEDQHPKERLNQRHVNPFILFLIILAAIFVFEILVMAFLSFLPLRFILLEALLDALLLTFLVSPFIFFVIVIPMMRNISELRQMKEKLTKAHDNLEAQVEERTSNLLEANRKLEEEIADRKRVEKVLELEKNKFKQYLDVVGVMIVAIDANQRVALANTTACEVLGVSEGQIPGKNWFDNYIPERMRDEMKSAFDSLIKGSPVQFEYCENPILAINGEEKLIAWHNTLLKDEEGKIIATLSSGEDITERKRAEEALSQSEEKYKKLFQEFNALLDAIPDSIVLLGPDQRIKWANKSSIFRKTSGMSEPIESYCYEAWHNSSSHCQGCPTLKSFLTGESASNRIVSSDNRLWDVRSFPVKDDSGTVNNVIEVASDITEKNRLEEEAMRAGHLASLGELAAGVAHEINNPINGIINYAQILINSMSEDSKGYEISNRIVKEGNRIALIVSSLLSFARESKDEKSHINIEDVISDSLALTQMQMKKEGISLEVDLPPGLPAIYGNHQQLQQVFLNLINNARYSLNEKYPKGDKEKIFAIRAECIKDGRKTLLRTAFRDHGGGIAPDVQEKMLNPFYSTKPVNEGTGLGLSISHGIVSDHSGDLSFNTVEGEFAEVIVDLPAITNRASKDKKGEK